MIENKEKCISPWFGFLVIVLVCILIASAIFFEFKGSNPHGRARRKAGAQTGGMQAAFPNPAADAQVPQDNLVF